MTKYLYSVLIVFLLISSCKTTDKKSNKSASVANTKTSDTVKISNPEVEYDVIIIEPGFNIWLNTTAKPKNFYSQDFLENKNIQYVNAWNIRVNQPEKFNPNLYETFIDYSQTTDYGYDVNYQLYNYFVYFQNKYKQNLLGGRVPAN